MSAWLSGNCIHVQVEMKLPAAGWGVLNFTSAGLRDWSLTDSMATCAQLTNPQVCSPLKPTSRYISKQCVPDILAVFVVHEVGKLPEPLCDSKHLSIPPLKTPMSWAEMHAGRCQTTHGPILVQSRL